MKREKVLSAALCVSAGMAVHFWQKDREAETQLAETLARVEKMETRLSQTQEQLAQAEEEKERAESDRDMFQLQYEYVTKKNNPIDHYILSPNRPVAFSTYGLSMKLGNKSLSAH